ncbi:MAG: CPBP family intramembrane metalloprotease [Candidatus Omnitrophica bacterium]|nr:CPBP family intramembrane metalloprotease [Candidatus Omnitrophota bacterium]
MECPKCKREISDTALRCRYCKKLTDGTPAPETKPYGAVVRENLLKNVQLFWNSGKNASRCPWSIADVAAISVLIWVFVFHDPFKIGFHLLKWLRLNFFIFTREPRLYHYLSIYINTIILKAISLFFLVVIVRARNISFRKTVLSRGEPLPNKEFWLPLYIAACIVFKMINDTNPLVPGIPFDSVFPEARILGNIVIIFSVLFVAPVVEEVLFRGFLYPAFNKYLGVYPSIIATTALFTLAHYPQVKEDALFVGVIAALSLAITFVKAKTGSTLQAIVMHHIYNLVVVLGGMTEHLMVNL